jgi:hypothetical protein
MKFFITATANLQTALCNCGNRLYIDELLMYECNLKFSCSVIYSVRTIICVDSHFIQIKYIFHLLVFYEVIQKFPN